MLDGIKKGAASYTGKIKSPVSGEIRSKQIKSRGISAGDSAKVSPGDIISVPCEMTSLTPEAFSPEDSLPKYAGLEEKPSKERFEIYKLCDEETGQTYSLNAGVNGTLVMFEEDTEDSESSYQLTVDLNNNRNINTGKDRIFGEEISGYNVFTPRIP